MSSRDDEHYEKIFIIFSRGMEYGLMRIIAGLLILLITFQVLLQFPPIRYSISKVDKLEGIQYKFIDYRTDSENS